MGWPMPKPDAGFQTFRYGPSESQAGDLYLPRTPRPPVVCLLHGGFWRVPHGREPLRAVAEDLVARGWPSGT
jgi:acetyl esterase/lipase